MTSTVGEAIGAAARFQRVSEALARSGLQLATAESCTGGMLAAGFTDLPGASRFLHAGFVTYSDRAKQGVLGVRPATLASHGAVSEPVVREMLAGALRSADIAAAITGVAGPGGGTAEKPVGTVWIAAGTRSERVAHEYLFEGDRPAIRAASVSAALDLLERILGAELEEGG
jgi:nicotinamide-nucleotide amidase